MDILQRALNEALNRNAAEKLRWTRYQEQHEGAKTNLQEFQKSLEIDIMVPIGSKALIPGRLYHTNEIVVSHSGTYYSKCTAHKALEICQNRLNIASIRLKALDSEAELHRNKLELPHDFDAFSSQEIIEEYDEEEEKRWRDEHKKKMREHKRKEAKEREKVVNGVEKDDIINKLDELELMEELENELEALSDEDDDDAIQSILNRSVELPPDKKRIFYLNDKSAGDKSVTSSVEDCIESIPDINGLLSDGDDDDDDVPDEYKKIEQKAKSMSNKEKLKLLKAELAKVQEFLCNCKPQTIEEFSHKTDQMFLSDHLLSAIETIEDELNCDQYLNGKILLNEESDSDTTSSVVQPSVQPTTQTKPILKKSNSKNAKQRKISFALEDDIKSFDGREEPSKISTTIIFEHGPILNLSINHSEAEGSEASEKSDVIRSPVDIYKQFADLTLNPSKEERRSSAVRTGDNSLNQPLARVVKDQTLGQDIAEAKTEVKGILDNIFGPKNEDEPDPLPDGDFVDTHQPKKRVSLFKQRRQMKNQ